MKHFLLIVSLISFGSIAKAADQHDYIQPNNGTIETAISGGDTISNYTISCSSSASTKIRAAVTDRTRRQICLENQGAQKVFISSSSTLAIAGWQLGESTNSAEWPQFCSNSSAALFCNTAVNIPTVTLEVLEQTASIP